MEKYIFYEDIPKEERNQLDNEVMKNNKSISLWGGISCGSAVLCGSTISKVFYPKSGDWVDSFIVALTITGLLAMVLWGALVKPRIIRAVERLKNS